MPNCLFHHHFIIAIENAVAKLKEHCQDSEEKLYGNGNPHQKAFNVDTQIPLMEVTLQNIKSIELSSSEPNWPQFREALISHIDQSKADAETQKSLKQSEGGKTIRTKLFIDFSNKLLAMFDDMRKDIGNPNFLSHGNEPCFHYTSPDYSKSPFLNQLINIAVAYRFNKIQEKHVDDTRKAYSFKHTKKWEALNEVIATWQEFNMKGITHIKTAVDGTLLSLINTEQKIENEQGAGVLGFLKGGAVKILKKGAQMTKSSEENRGLLNSKLNDLYGRFESTCDEAAFANETAASFDPKAAASLTMNP